MPPVTIKEIAKQAGLARSTVSEILSGKNNYCSEENRKRVKKIAAELGYRPNIGFRIMTNRDTGTYSLIFSQERTYYTEVCQTLASLLLREIEKKQGSAYTAIFDEYADANIERIRELISRGSRNFIFLGHPVGAGKIYELLREENCNYSGFNGFTGSGSRHCIMVDYVAGFRRYFQYFKDNSMPFKFVASQSFFDKVAIPLCKEFNLDPSALHLPIVSLDHIPADCSEIYYRMVQEKNSEFIRNCKDVCGWICGSDIEAAAIARNLLAAGLPVTADFGPLVCGFGNTAVARFSVLPIITAELKLNKVTSFLLESLECTDDKVVFHQPEIIFEQKFQPEIPEEKL